MLAPLAARNALVSAAATFLIASAPAGAQPVQRGTEYILALSWSPNYCRGPNGHRSPMQCDGDADRRFIVHGLWPNVSGRPVNDCPDRFGGPRRATVEAMLPIMPDRGLVRHQWRKHGTCSGLSPSDYFATVREARDRVTVPPGLATLNKPITVTPQVLRRAFQAANPQIPDDGISVRCQDNRLVEVRVCMSNRLEFQSCQGRVRRCRADQLHLRPPL
ncbi:MAG: ribonuclease T2 [Pseudomonadota bacterium]